MGKDYRSKGALVSTPSNVAKLGKAPAKIAAKITGNKAKRG